MFLMVSGSGLDWDSDIVKTINSYGYEIRHYKLERGETSFYFDMPPHLIDVVIMGSKDAVPYQSFVEELSNVLKKKKGIKIYTIQDDVAAGETAIVDYHNEEILLRLELPKGTLYDEETVIPVKMILKNITAKPIEAKINRNTLFQVRVTDLRNDDMLLLEGEETDTEQTYKINPQDTLTDEFTINVEDFKGNIQIVGLTHFFNYKGNPTLFQTAPIRVTIK
ncbi:MAG: hypothetical protein QXR19_12140 [Candidatus Jordarchaeaceae archaeon]